MKVLVTGAGGMVGSHMVELLHDQGHDVLGTYYKPTTDIMEIDPSIRMEECDVRYYQAVQRVISKFQPDQIYHLAAPNRIVDSSASNDGNEYKRYNQCI